MQVIKSKKVGLSLAILGWIGAIVTCALPMWKVSIWKSIGTGTEQTTWKGIWRKCEDSTGQMQCEIYDSTLTLSSDLQAAGPLCIVAILMGVLGIFFYIMCTRCVKEEHVKARVMIAAGVTFICAAVLLLIPVTWATYSTIKDMFKNGFRMISTDIIEGRKIGASLYLGWASTALLLGGGSILCCNRLPDQVKDVFEKAINALMS